MLFATTRSRIPDGSSGNMSALESFAAVTTSQAVESKKRNSAGVTPTRTRFVHVLHMCLADPGTASKIIHFFGLQRARTLICRASPEGKGQCGLELPAHHIGTLTT